MWELPDFFDNVAVEKRGLKIDPFDGAWGGVAPVLHGFPVELRFFWLEDAWGEDFIPGRAHPVSEGFNERVAVDDEVIV